MGKKNQVFLAILLILSAFGLIWTLIYDAKSLLIQITAILTAFALLYLIFRSQNKRPFHKTDPYNAALRRQQKKTHTHKEHVARSRKRTKEYPFKVIDGNKK
ncbi:hypothetical protein [Rubeoparvulum massiliense]|uniref:hypothetical protein n=1 Tax=Rubeoparvulum massiliense TaxID=1631346 RepID=UPI00065E0FA0|nr:hypothetical protein [Rubeoparvulum massiliense]